MRILLISRDIHFGGAGVYFRTIINEIQQNREIEYTTVISPLQSLKSSPKIKYVALSSFGNTFILKEPIFMIKSWFAIRSELKRRPYDLVFANSSFLASAVSRVPLVAVFHSLHSNYTELRFQSFQFYVAKMFHRMYSYFDLQTIRRARKVIFVSKKTLVNAVSYYGRYKNKFVYLPVFIDPDVFLPHQNADKKIIRSNYRFTNEKYHILYVGRLDPLKGIDRLIKTVDEINSSGQLHKKIVVHVAGEGILGKGLTRYHTVRQLGKLPHETLNDLYNAADLYVLPSYYENCPTTVLEAAASGCPILASNVGDIEQILKEERVVFNLDDQTEFRSKLINLLTMSDQEKKKMTQKYSDRIRTKYDKTAICNKLFSLVINIK